MGYSGAVTIKDYATRLGRLLANLHSLEFLLRSFLQDQPSVRPIGLPYGTDLHSFPIGSQLPENELTSYDSLGHLISKFNGEMKARGIDGIDSSLVELRDALAHGRVSAAALTSGLRLIKFDRPVKGTVRVTFNSALTQDWFKSETWRVLDAMRIVAAQIPSVTSPDGLASQK